MKASTIAIMVMLALIVGCGAGGDPSFSPDPTVGETQDDGGSTGDGGDATDSSTAAAEEERDCFLDGFCYRECESASECPDGFSCILSVCTFDCQSDAECGVGGVCNDVGLCEASDGAGMPLCTEDADCGEGRFCNANGDCEQVPIMLGCQSDVDCPLGQYCNDVHSCDVFPGPGVTCSVDGDCPGNYYCDAFDECQQDCRAHSQCADGEACNDVGRCVAVGVPTKLINVTFGALGSETDPAGPVTFESTSFSLSSVQITPAGRNQVLTSPSYRLTGSLNY